MNLVASYKSLSQTDLLDEAPRLAKGEREHSARLIAVLVAIDANAGYRGAGYPSLFKYCTGALKLSEDQAYVRTEIVQAARMFPRLLDLLHEGLLTIASIRLLIPALTLENETAVLAAAAGRSKRDVELQVAALRPKPDVPPVVRKLPEPRLAPSVQEQPSQDVAPSPTLLSPLAPGLLSPPPSHRPIVAPLSPVRFKLQCTLDQPAHEDLRRLQALMRHQIPNGDPAAIVKKALALLRADVEKKKFGKVGRPRRSEVPRA